VVVVLVNVMTRTMCSSRSVTSVTVTSAKAAGERLVYQVGKFLQAHRIQRMQHVFQRDANRVDGRAAIRVPRQAYLEGRLDQCSRQAAAVGPASDSANVVQTPTAALDDLEDYVYVFKRNHTDAREDLGDGRGGGVALYESLRIHDVHQ